MEKIIPFTKSHCGGNDFICVDNRNEIVPKEIVSFVKKVCQRKFGIGADGLLLLERDKRLDYKMRYFNSDGSKAEFCGNGARCLAVFAHMCGIRKERMRLRSNAGTHTVYIKDTIVKLKMPSPEDIRQAQDLALQRKKGRHKACPYFVRIGVPHIVIFSEEIDRLDVVELGKEIRYNPLFSKEGTNVDFCQFLGRNRLKVRTYERGIEDETYSCGTGAVACAVIAYLKGMVSSPVEIIFSKNVDTIYFDKKLKEIFLEGKVEVVYEGRLKNFAIQD